jgi:hypothetical protein
MNRLIEEMVLVGFITACRFAGSPTLRSAFSVNATIEGVVRRPSLLGITTGSLPSITATQELVVPKSIPMIFPILLMLYNLQKFSSPFQVLCQGKILVIFSRNENSF